MAHTVALTLHIAAGVAGLILGPVAMFAAKRRGRHTRAGTAYHWVFLVLFLSAVALAVMNWDEVWWLAPVGAFSYTFALVGYLAARRRRGDWLRRHVIGQGGSYIAMTTALLVVNWNDLTGAQGFQSVVPWIVPTLVGSPLIVYVAHEVAAGRRPRRRGTHRARSA
jgi:hypothetical protein